MNRFVYLVCIMMVVSACGGVSDPTALSPSETATPNQVIVTLDTTRRSQELPPTWTPTDTPTITPTPSRTPTLTVTPSPTSIDFDLLCAAFSTTTAIEDGDTYDEGDTIRLSYGIAPEYAYAFVGVVLEHDDLEQPIADIAPGGSDYTSTFVIADFPYSGRWDYRFGAFLLNGDDILCRQDGYFYVAEKTIPTTQPNLIPTAMPYPSITPQSAATDEPEPDCTFAC